MKRLNRKGFTLVELLAVIVVTSLVLVLSGYGIINAYKNAKGKVIVLNEKSILEAARISSTEAESGDWKALNGNYQYFCTTIQRLKNFGLLKKEAVSNDHDDTDIITIGRNIHTLAVEDAQFLGTGDGDEVLNTLCNIKFYTIHYDYNVSGGETGIVPSDQKAEVSVNTYISSFAPSRNGFDFAGWNTKTDGTGSTYKSGASFTYNDEGTITLYAMWESNTYTIEYYNGNNETTEGATQIGDSSCNPGKACTINVFSSGIPFSDKGWEFAGWTDSIDSNSADTTKVKYESGKSYNISNNKDVVIKLYAVFKRDIIFYSGVNKSISKKGTQYYNPYCYDKNYYTPVNIPSAKGIPSWTNLGYTTVDDDAGNKEYFESKGKDIYVNSIKRTPEYSPQLFAIYERGLTLRFNANGGTGTVPSNLPLNQYYNTGDVITSGIFTLPTTSLTKTGYSFGGWSDGTDVSYGPNADYNFSPIVSDTTVTKTLSAIWNDNDYNIIFDSNSNGEATGTMESMDCRTGIEYTLNSNNYSWYGHVFTGWKDDNGNFYADGAKVRNLIPSGAITLHAQWDDQTYTITFAKNGATSIGSSSLTCVKNVACQLPTITRDEYEIIGWGTSASSTSPVNNQYVGNSDIKLYAITRKKFNIKFNYNNSGFSLENVSGSTVSGNVMTVSCYMYNTSTGCGFRTPMIDGNTTSNNGYFYSTNSKETRSYASGKSGLLFAGAGDNSRNHENNTTYYVAYKKVTISFYPNGAKLDGGTSSLARSCITSLGYDGHDSISTSCSVTAPTITRNNYDIVGWGTSDSSKTAESNPTVSSSSKKLYAITKRAISITFDANDSGLELSGTTGTASRRVVSCSIYNTNIYCVLGTPMIDSNTTSGNGFFYSKSSTESNPRDQDNPDHLYAGANGRFTENTTYYVAYGKINVIFNANGATISSNSGSCIRPLNSNSCSITSPTITRNNYNIVGWSTSSNATSSSWGSNTSKSISSDGNRISNYTYYAITKKTISITFDANGSGLSLENLSGSTGTSSKRVVSCDIYNNNSGCLLTVPKIAGKTTGENGYYYSNSSTESNSRDENNSNHLYAGGSKTFTTNATYYVAYGKINVTFNANGATISSNSGSCVRPLNGNSCSITSPTITRNDGYEVIGLSTSSDATSSSWNSNTSKSISSDGNRITNYTYYAITKKTISVTFDANGSGLSLENLSGSTGTSSKRVVSCDIYNTNQSCSIKTPKINDKTSSESGYFYSKSSTESNPRDKNNPDHVFAGGSGSSNNFENGGTYYVAYGKINVTFNANGATISSNSESCIRPLNSNSCSITSPTITRDDDYETVGWSESSDGTSSSWGSNTSKSISSDGNRVSNYTYYAITKKTIAITFDANGSELSLENVSGSTGTSSKRVVSCDIYNNNSGCLLTVPKIAGKTTGENGYYYSNSSTESNPRDEYNSNHLYAGGSKSFAESSTYYVAYGKINVTFNANGATISSNSGSCVRPLDNNSCVILSPTITRSGYDIVGWSTNSNATTADWSPNTTKTIYSNGSRVSNYTYYAITKQQTTSNNYSLYLNPNGGNWGSGGSATKIFNYVDSANISSFPAVGYGLRRLYGWRVGNTSTIVRYTVDYQENGKTLYAYWSQGNCTCSNNKECEVDSGALTECLNNVCVFKDQDGNNIGYVCQ